MTEPSKPPLGRMKARAPPPPQVPQPAPRHIFRNTVPDGGGTSDTDAKENVLRTTVELQLTLPQGYQTSVTEDGSKALMDLLVELCSCYHLNPALHTLELLSPDGHPLGFKPNTLLGSLNVASVLIKEKVWEEKSVRRPAPKVPEKTVRLMVNYHSSQKAVVRVNPLVPLQALIPVICDKCDFDPSHVLLLKDSISQHELPLDKSLTQLGIKELYILDQSLVLQLKMASAPALNYADSIRSSTTSLGRPEKKGLLGIFQFSRRKSKTETTSMDMDDSDDKLIQNTDTHSNASSSVSGVPCVEDRPSTLGQSQSAMNISRMSPKFDSKKRRAPVPPGAPTPTMGHTSFETYQMGLGSESQQRKRKAPAPPPTPTSIDDTSTSTAPSPDSPATETPTPATRIKVAQSTTVGTTTVVRQTVKPAPLKTEVHPLPVYAATPTPSSPTPSSSTTDSLAAQDSSSEFSHSLDDSDLDPDQTGSRCSSLTSSTVSGSVRVRPTTKSSSSRMEESEMVSSVATELNQEVISVSSSRSETESALNLKMDEVENNRHSGMAWLPSMKSSTVSGQIPEAETPEEETLSVGSSIGGISLPDQGYAASEGMAEGEDSGLVSSPSDTQPTSPDESLSLDGSSGGGGERLQGPVRENSSDSDEGCATWGSRHRHDDINPKAKSGRLKDSYEQDSQLTAQLHQTLVDLEADLADHVDMVSETTYTMSTDSNEVPVSVVDMDVPVTAIDEVLEDYGSNFVECDTKLLIRTESAHSKGPSSAVELQNTNNNACTAADDNKSSSTHSTQPSQRKKSLKNKSVKKKEKILETKVEEMTISHANSLKEDKQKTPAVKSNVETQKHSKNAQIVLDPVKSNTQLQEKKPVLPPTYPPRLASTEGDEETQINKITRNSSSSNSSHGKITRNVTSRFGMKTFTVVPPKHSVMHADMREPALTRHAIKIDEQGNMVKTGISHNRVGGSSELKSNCSEGSPLLGKAKAFWSLNERQESPVPQSKGLIDKAKESTDDLKSTQTAVSKTVLKTGNIEDLKKTPSTLNKSGERSQPKESVKEEAKEPVKDVKVAKEERVEVESKISVSKNVQQPSNGPTLPHPSPSDLKRDLPFLKPSRRTSSQYVASAITKYAPKTSAKPNSIPYSPESSAPLKTQGTSFQRSGRSIQVNPRQSSQTSLYNNKENDSVSNPLGPKRSMSFPEYMYNTQRDFGEVRQDRGGFGNCVGSTKESSNSLGTPTAKHIRSTGPTQINVTASNDRDNINNIQGRSPSTSQSSSLHTSAKQPTAPKTESQEQTSNTTDIIKAAHHLTSGAKSEPSVTVSDSGTVPGPLPVTVFGPIKRFRPVICKSVEKDTTLHSSLMDAIQTGGGKDRLKKISTSGPSNLKKTSYAEEENERSALLSAIRAQSNSGKLRKVAAPTKTVQVNGRLGTIQASSSTLPQQ
ncbi:protein cordon-bleu isoform X1 [Scomber scombrus]|uniref:Protein cordon-bleu isoform X1 n=1 Tax=Scomber scombrus TaxID=13677 RepID=A0AAV1N4F5_SCOSC